MAEEFLNYQPRAGVLPGLVLAFFVANPEEELTSVDIADKWDVRPPSSVFGALERVVRMGLLTREKAGKYAVLRPGPNLARWASVQPVARGAQMAMGGDALPDRARGPVPVGALEIRLTLHVHGAGTPFARVEIAGVEP